MEKKRANGWMDERTDGWADGRMNRWTDGRMEGRTNGRTNGWTDERMDGWKDGRMGGSVSRCSPPPPIERQMTIDDRLGIHSSPCILAYYRRSKSRLELFFS